MRLPSPLSCHAMEPTLMSHRSKKLKIFALATLTLLSLTVLGAVVGYWMVVPSMAEDALRQRLSKLEQRADLQVSIGDIQPNGLQGITISAFTIKDPNAPPGHELLLEVDSLLVNVDKKKLIMPDEAIKEVGSYVVEVKFGHGVKAPVKLEVKTRA